MPVLKCSFSPSYITQKSCACPIIFCDIKFPLPKEIGVIGELKMVLQNSLWDVLAFSWVWKFVIMEENFKVS